MRDQETLAVPPPRFAELTTDEANALLDRNHVGRLCFLNGGLVDIQPVYYAMADEWIFVRSALGTKLEALARHPYVAFEVDELRGLFDWQSVVARGTVYQLPPNGTLYERRAFDRAVRALRRMIPHTLTADDPTPFRQSVFGIHVDTLTGRSAEPGGR